MSYVITGLPVAVFQPLFGLDEAELAAYGAIRVVVETKPSAPCRISLVDADPGETVLLLNYEHQDAPTPYRSTHAIYVREAATRTARLVDEIPEVLRGRLLAVRAYDAQGMMIDAEVLQDEALEPLIENWLDRPQIAYLHVHNAKRGCYAARIDRA